MAEKWIKVASCAELPVGKMKRVDIKGHRYLIANAEGEIYAVDDLCSHEEVSLYLGCIEGENIKCSLHGSRFSLKNGTALEEPATEPIGAYSVKITQDLIFIRPKN
ncbi:MAG: non-heme iron oxygenase ferredoxin subunit [Candidatus Thiodiazotropha sp.]|nr:non-heme iron oxygenase ferredoxin subunit [Candidatus Thiodiazotropha sp.]MCM8883382.1 non-heme iron oxygenase ferredoxin subunit [Candidatus Thiodiazotropha sp.]MCM8919173.1 non-heme iron oxygenase ferredoxin subunit [Candidatus Thiodiazotropha sp.]